MTNLDASELGRTEVYCTTQFLFDYDKHLIFKAGLDPSSKNHKKSPFFPLPSLFSRERRSEFTAWSLAQQRRQEDRKRGESNPTRCRTRQSA
jgi:hypothetical protein